MWSWSAWKRPACWRRSSRPKEYGSACIQKPPGIRLGTFGRLRSLFHELGPDVVHTHQIGALFYAGPAAAVPASPWWCIPSTASIMTSGGGRGGWAGWPGVAQRGSSASRRISPRQPRRIASCPATSCTWSPTGSIPIGSATAATGTWCGQSLGIPPGAPLIGTVGRLCEVKRHDLLIRAFRQVHARLADARLLLVGDGPWMGRLHELVAGLGLTDRVHFAGYQPRPERYLQAMDVFALTSQSEGMPLVVLEAWASGVPVVATRVGGLPELVEDGRTGILVDFGDNAALAHALGDLIADPSRARRVGEAGRDRVESRYSLRRMADEYQRHYNELLDCGVPSSCAS